MEAIEIQKTKDEVAKKYGYENWWHFLRAFRNHDVLPHKVFKLENEVTREVAKQVAEAKNKICYYIVADGTPTELLDGTLKLRINLSKSPEIK